MPIAPVFKTDNPPSDLRAVPMESAPVTKLENPYRDLSPSQSSSEETPESATKTRFRQPVVVQLPGATGQPRSEIDEVIQSGKYSEIPPAEMVSASTGSGPSHLSIVNETACALTNTFYASAQRSVTVEAGQTLEPDMEPGAYRELCRADSLTVLPFVGKDEYAVGTAYKSTYYLTHHSVRVP